MFRVLAVGGSPARPTVTQVLLNEDADTRVSMVETSASARVVVEDEEFDVGVIETADEASAIQTLASILEVAPLLPFVVVTDAETGPPALFDQGAQDHLCRADITQASLVRSCRHAIVRRAAAARAEAQARRSSTGAAPGSGFPEALLLSTSEEPTDGLLSTLARLLDSEPLADVTVERLRQETGLGESQLRRARRPMGNLLLYLIKRDLDAEHDLIATCFRNASGDTASLQQAVETTVRTFANFWRQAPASVRLATDYTGLDARLADLRFEHLRRLSDAAVELLGEHRAEVRQDDPDQALVVAIDQLLAVLDHQRLIGALHPSNAGPDEVIAEFAAQVTFFLAGPAVEADVAAGRQEPAAAPTMLFAETPPDPVVVRERPAPRPVVAVVTPEPVPATLEPEPEPVLAAVTPDPEPEPVAMPASSEPAPEPVVAVANPDLAPAPDTAAAGSARTDAGPDEEERVTAALRRLQQVAAAPQPEPAAAAPVADEEERVTAALRRLEQATAGTEALSPRPTPREDPFVTATPPPSPPEAEPRAEASSLFSRRATTSTEGAPVFDPRRIVIEENLSDRPPEGEPPSGRTAAAAAAAHSGGVTPRTPATSGRVFSAIPKSDAPGGHAAAPTFDLGRIVVEQARASVA